MIPVPFRKGFCPNCEIELVLRIVDQPALFIYAGYGATVRTIITRCTKCGWELESEQTEINPRRLSNGSL